MKHPITLRINGDDYRVAVDPWRTLNEVIREDLNLTGTKLGCGSGDCGACTVMVDGRTVSSCLTLAVEVDGQEITTVEGIAPSGDKLHPIQEAFIEKGAIQCGFCTPGMEMSALYLLRQNPSPDEEEIRWHLSGNLCRCTGYNKIVEAHRGLRRKDHRKGCIGNHHDRLEDLNTRHRRAWPKPSPAGQKAATSARVMAGGTDLLIKIRHGALAPRFLVGLKKIPDLNRIIFDETRGLVIGATALLGDVAAHPDVNARYPGVAFAARNTANVQIRNMGTVVGNLCNASPSADNAPTLLALGAVLTIEGPTGQAGAAPGPVFQRPRPHRPGTGGNRHRRCAFLPRRPDSGAAYQFISARGKLDCSAVGAGAMVAMEGDICTEARVFVGACGPTPMRAVKAEQLLKGQKLSDP